jgi:hypothetical protein
VKLLGFGGTYPLLFSICFGGLAGRSGAAMCCPFLVRFYGNRLFLLVALGWNHRLRRSKVVLAWRDVLAILCNSTRR